MSALYGSSRPCRRPRRPTEIPQPSFLFGSKPGRAQAMRILLHSQICRYSPTLTVRFTTQLRIYSTQKSYEPLRILFCGSDEFSSASLRALHNERQKDPALIASIDVVCRPGKPVGRGLRTIRKGTAPRKTYIERPLKRQYSTHLGGCERIILAFV